LSSTIPTSLNILVVEDDPIIRALVGRMLRGLGFSPDFAKDGREAFESVRMLAYDVIFMDLNMPFVDGITATYAIREWERQEGARRKPAKIVATTSNVSREDRDRCAAAGMDEFIGKPVSLERLRAVLC
jgi:CheY-like chemotaxis protein